MSPRQPRAQLSTYTCFHLCSHANGSQNLFITAKDRIKYLQLFERYRVYHSLDCFAYCLMDNHTHLLVRCPSVAVLSKAMHRLHVAYAMYFNLKHQRKGHLFQDRFSSWVIRDEAHIAEAKRYIEENPVAAGLVQEVKDYRWSSARAMGDDPYVNVCGIKGS
ncbi:MAG: transposase [Candidatus Omnitrophica bacterium]|nr:transposase [Candidatus Omnitrophota bacterium]